MRRVILLAIVMLAFTACAYEEVPVQGALPASAVEDDLAAVIVRLNEAITKTESLNEAEAKRIAAWDRYYVTTGQVVSAPVERYDMRQATVTGLVELNARAKQETGDSCGITRDTAVNIITYLQQLDVRYNNRIVGRARGSGGRTPNTSRLSRFIHSAAKEVGMKCIDCKQPLDNQVRLCPVTGFVCYDWYARMSLKGHEDEPKGVSQ